MMYRTVPPPRFARPGCASFPPTRCSCQPLPTDRCGGAHPVMCSPTPHAHKGGGREGGCVGGVWTHHHRQTSLVPPAPPQISGTEGVVPQSAVWAPQRARSAHPAEAPIAPHMASNGVGAPPPSVGCVRCLVSRGGRGARSSDARPATSPRGCLRKSRARRAVSGAPVHTPHHPRRVPAVVLHHECLFSITDWREGAGRMFGCRSFVGARGGGAAGGPRGTCWPHRVAGCRYILGGA